MNIDHGVIVREAYKDYTAPIEVADVVNRLLSAVPKERLVGLKTVVLTSSQNLSKPVRKSKAHARGKSYELGKCRGQYHQEWKNQPAWIELFVDNTLAGWPLTMLRVPLFRDWALADVLFHELGHHIHKTQAPEFKEQEDVAEQWQRKLSRPFFRRHHWYLWIVVLPLWPFVRIHRYIKKRKEKANHGLESTGAPPAAEAPETHP